MSEDVKNIKTINLIKRILSISAISMVGLVGVVFAVLYVDTFKTGFWFDYSVLVKSISVSLISIITILTIVFLETKKEFIYKLFLLTIAIVAIALVGLYLLSITGFYQKISSVEQLREYISSFGSFAIVLFIIIQFSQVVFLPIPSFITVGAGVLLFGPLKGALFSCVGIITGSLVAYFIGRVFGYKVAKWLVGEDSLKKGLKLVKGKDVALLTFMFLFPFFPDDVLCFVAGLTTMTPIYFMVMIVVVRIITVFATSYSMNNSIIPYDTWWGILLWILFFILTGLLTWFIYKKGDKIEEYFKNKKNNK